MNNIKKYRKRLIPIITNHINTLDQIIENGSLGSDVAVKHKTSLLKLLEGKVSSTDIDLENIHESYEKIPVSSCDSFLLKAKGDCILGRILISNLFKDKEGDDDGINALFGDNGNSPDANLSFIYLWLSFEVSHMKLYSSLRSMSELFMFFVDGSMIMVGGMVQTMPPTHFPQFFAYICEYWRNVYASQALRSLGSNETRYLLPLKIELSKKELENKSILEADINDADKRMNDILSSIKDDYSHVMPGMKDLTQKQMLTAIQQPLSKDNKISYLELFSVMIRNFKKSSGGKRITNMFKDIPITLDDAILNENHLGLFTLIYTDMYNKDNKKTDDEVSKELFLYAVNYSHQKNYGIAGIIAEEAKAFNRSSQEIQQFIEDNGTAMFEKELKINLNDDFLL